MPLLFASLIVVLLATLVGLHLWRWSDERHACRAWRMLRQRARKLGNSFMPSMVEALPDAARKFFLFSIRPGSALHTVAEIDMAGEIGLGTKEKPNYLPMRARQILAPPFGLVWKLNAGRGPMQVSGSDGFDGRVSWVRFWLLKTLPVARAGGDNDHARAAFGRVVAESVFWAPAALLPQNDVTWESIGNNVVRATVAFNDISQTVDITVAEDGRPIKVVIPRWTDANPDKVYRVQPFGGFPTEFREFEGYTLATCVEGGNFIGTDDYFPFYKARVRALRFVDLTDRSKMR